MVRRVLAALLLPLLLSSVFAASKPAKPAKGATVDFTGTWKLDLFKSQLKHGGIGANKLVINQTPEEIQIDYFAGENDLGSDVFLTNGHERQRWVTKQERAFCRVQFRNKEKEMVVTTRGVLDVAGTQQYTDTESWKLSADGKTLTNDQKDGNNLVFVKDEQRDDPAQPAK
jgi:hypothetical protein